MIKKQIRALIPSPPSLPAQTAAAELFDHRPGSRARRAGAKGVFFRDVFSDWRFPSGRKSSLLPEYLLTTDPVVPAPLNTRVRAHAHTSY